MEYVTIHFTPTADGWKSDLRVKSSYPALKGGHPRTIRTDPEQILPGLRGLSVGAVAGVLRLALPSLGALPLCTRCADELGESWAEL